jgi:hypothetical protein
VIGSISDQPKQEPNGGRQRCARGQEDGLFTMGGLLMRKITVSAMVAGFLALATFSARAEEAASSCSAARRQGPPSLMLLNRRAVREDLKLNDEQARQVREALVKQIAAFVDAMDRPWQERRASMTALRKQSDAMVAQILSADQSARLKQITLQLQGPRAFGNPEVAQALGITPEQQQKLRSIHAEARKEFDKVFQNGRPQGEEAWKAIKDMHQRVQTQALAVLTDSQKTRWDEMTGAPIQGDLHAGWFGAGRRGPHCQE